MDAHLDFIIGSPRAGQCVVRKVMSQQERVSDLCKLQAEPGINPGILTPHPMPRDKAHSRVLCLGLDISGAKRVTSGHLVSSICCSNLDVEKW